MTDFHAAWRDDCQAWLDANIDHDAIPEMLWVDVESTGLEPEEGQLLEVGMLVTDRHGFVVPGGMTHTIIGLDPDYRVSEVIHEMHTPNGLLDAARKGRKQTWEVEADFLDFVDRHFGTVKPPTSGSSVGFDRKWLHHHMPALDDRFHYRIIDNSTLKELAKLHNPELVTFVPPAMGVHRVLPDLIDTISEYRFYVSEFLWTQENSEGFRRSIEGQREL